MSTCCDILKALDGAYTFSFIITCQTFVPVAKLDLSDFLLAEASYSLPFIYFFFLYIKSFLGFEPQFKKKSPKSD